MALAEQLGSALTEADGFTDGAGPPAVDEAECLGDAHRGQAGQRELDREPLGAGDALGPGQVERPGLELAGDERGTPEDADDRGRYEDEPDAEQIHGGVEAGQLAEERVGGGLAGEAVATDDLTVGVQAGQGRAGGCQQDRERGQRRGRGDSLDAELPPGQPDHFCTSRWWLLSRRRRPVAWLM